MSDVLKDLQPRKVFEYFEAISAIPRESGNEKAISDYMVQFANSLGLEVHQDEAYNIYIKKPATPGYEHLPAVILQGHMDMVCEKNKDTIHDFEKEGLKLFIDGDWIRAKGTTLGGDNGIAIAIQMAILSDHTLKHPALECLMTTDEERGMTGVANMRPEYLEGKVLINIDNEQEGEFIVSCAGGAKAYSTLRFNRVAIKEGSVVCKMTINGLKGGHSGAEIHHERANAHLLMGRLLQNITDQVALQVLKVEGGTKDNVITRECEVWIAVRAEDKEKVTEVANEMESIFKAEYEVQDPEITIKCEMVQCEGMAMDAESTQKFINYLLVVPNGVMGYAKHMEGLVETSLNLGIVKMDENSIRFASAVRSSVASRKAEILSKLKALAESFGMVYEVKGDYPAWQYNSQSRIRELAVDLFEKMYGKSPTVTAIHAGLECGFIAEKCPGLDMISIGPDLEHIHSPEERLSISSTARIYEYILQLLENLASY
ncbi:MAG: aminoacyl-histidine dipeptidase [Cellulosilyticum sp.]|nr:aminoacyl-histidine dipeptidase [Cellulosilyticum sp.]